MPVGREPADQPHRRLRVTSMRHPPQRIPPRLAHPPQRRRLALPARRLRQIPQLVEGASDKHQHRAGTLIARAGIGLEPVQPRPELNWPVDIHLQSMPYKPYVVQGIPRSALLRACRARARAWNRWQLAPVVAFRGGEGAVSADDDEQDRRRRGRAACMPGALTEWQWSSQARAVTEREESLVYCMQSEARLPTMRLVGLAVLPLQVGADPPIMSIAGTGPWRSLLRPGGSSCS